MRRALCWLSAFLAASGCAKGLEQEPNDHFTQATRVGAKTLMEGTMRAADDVDVYRLEPGRKDQVLSLHIGGIRTMDFVLGLLDKDRRELKRFDETAQGGDEKAFDIGLSGEAYYVVVSNKNPSAANPEQRYALAFQYGPAADREREPNDRALDANALTPGTLLRGRYFPSRNLLAEENDFQEEDWFRVDVHEDGAYLLNIDVSEVPGVDAVLEVYGPNNYRIKEVDAGGPGEPEVLKGFGLRGPVHYYLRLFSKSRSGANADIPYQILTELIPYRGGGEFEPNDQRLEATLLSEERISGTIAPAGDTDWYKLQVQGEGRRLLTAQVEGVEGLDLRLSLADDLGKVMLSADDRGKETPEVLTGVGIPAGTYYLVVSEAGGKAADARRPYVLNYRTADYPQGLEFELNDSSAAAQSLSVGDAVDGFLAPKGDMDWFFFNVYQAAEIRLDCTGLLNVTLALSLFDQEGKAVGETSAPAAGEPLSLSLLLEPGSYWARLSAASPEGHNIRDRYTLRVSAR